jgi:salicylate biosynthesis isochorismate synthase
MLIPRDAIADLATRLGSMPDGLRSVSTQVDLDPLDVVRSGAEAFGFAGFFASPDGVAVGALGSASTTALSGGERLAGLDRALGDLPDDAIAMVGFAFDQDGPGGTGWEGFPGAAAVLPSITVVRRGGRSTLGVTLAPGADPRMLLALLSTLGTPLPPARPREVDHTVESRPTASDWRDTVAEAVAAIKAGAMQKVVLARTVQVRTGGPIDGFGLVGLLRDQYPGCRVFGWRAGDAVFVGASPELLVSRAADRFHLRLLAGSAPRSEEADEDRRLGDALLASGKDRLEHAIVVEDAVARLHPIVEHLDRPAEPVLERYATVQHLATPVTGTTSARLFGLAEAIHPTPAVGGAPRGEALAFIDKMEDVDRGWYAGGIGWADASGDGELALALRCALVRGDTALLFAGNGIVADSDPDDELDETRLKLRPLLDLLT